MRIRASWCGIVWNGAELCCMMHTGARCSGGNWRLKWCRIVLYDAHWCTLFRRELETKMV